MTRRRVLVDFEFQIDEGAFKAAALGPDGVADVDDGLVRDLVTRMLMDVDWTTRGVLPLRAIVTPRILGRSGWYEAMHLRRDRGAELS
jgi:hypothetical protein